MLHGSNFCCTSIQSSPWCNWSGSVNWWGRGCMKSKTSSCCWTGVVKGWCAVMSFCSSGTPWDTGLATTASADWCLSRVCIQFRTTPRPAKQGREFCKINLQARFSSWYRQLFHLWQNMWYCLQQTLLWGSALVRDHSFQNSETSQLFMQYMWTEELLLILRKMYISFITTNHIMSAR
jgi:hypothetical protein